MKIIKLECVLMDNKEIIFNGRILSTLTQEEIEKFVEIRGELD